MEKTYIIIICILLMLTGACKKENTAAVPRETASIFVINAVAGGGAVKVNAGAGNSFVWSKATDLTNGGSSAYGAFIGINIVTVVGSSDTTKALFNKTVNLQSVNTLYLTGISPNIDTMFRTEENFPFIDGAKIDADNSMYIRFVNLSPGSNPLNVRITTSATNEVSGLGYKGISSFKKYEALATTPDYSFEVKDPVTGFTATYKLLVNTYRYKTLSIVFRGIAVVPPATITTPFTVFAVSYN